VAATFEQFRYPASRSFCQGNQDARVQILSMTLMRSHLTLQGILKTFVFLLNLPFANAASSFGSSTPLIMACSISLPDIAAISLTTPLSWYWLLPKIFWIRLISDYAPDKNTTVTYNFFELTLISIRNVAGTQQSVTQKSAIHSVSLISVLRQHRFEISSINYQQSKTNLP